MDDAIGRKAQLQQQSDARRARLAELGASIQQLRADVAAAPVDAPAHMHAQHGELVAQSNAVLNGVTDAEEVLAERRQQAVGLERSIHANAQVRHICRPLPCVSAATVPSPSPALNTFAEPSGAYGTGRHLAAATAPPPPTPAPNAVVTASR